MGEFPGFRFAKVAKDRSDLRDLVYAPTLRALRRRLSPPPELLERLEGRPLINGLVRDQLKSRGQDASSSCTAQALSGIIDILRLLDGSVPRVDLGRMRVSAEMLYDQGRSIEAAELGKSRPTEGLTSLRSVIKAFYHNGVCTESQWGGSDGKVRNDGKDVVVIAKAARDIPLGAYYRLRPILNDYHAALNDVGAIFAAAEIHAGWSPDAVRRTGKIEVALAHAGPTGNHAFVIIGYDEQGFLVLNSWGADWGGHRTLSSSADDPRLDGRETRWPGIAHWSYQDWAERIIDGWVLRLGVPTPNAFEYSFGEHGIGAFAGGAIRSGSTPRHELIGHYIHLDDGTFVGTGAFPSDPDSIRTTVDLLNDRVRIRKPDHTVSAKGARVYSKVLLWFAGGNERTKDAITDAVITKEYWKQQGIYPITVLWCSDFVENTMVVLDRLFEAALGRIGKPGSALDRQIEIEARGIGRAFWRDIKGSARRAASADGDGTRSRGGMYRAFDELLHIDPAIEMHVVAEGAGAILLAELIEAIVSDQMRPPWAERLSRIKSLTLLAPACTTAVFEETLLKWHRHTQERILLLVPDEETEARMTTGLYQNSVTELVQRSFEEEEPGDSDGLPPEAVRILGTARAAKSMKRLRKAVRVRWLDGPEPAGPIARLRAVTFSPDALGQIAAHIKGGDAAKAPKIVREANMALAPSNAAALGQQKVIITPT